MSKALRIQKLSLVLEVLLVAGLILLPIEDAYIWFFHIAQDPSILEGANFSEGPLPLANSLLGYVVGWLPLSIELMGIWWLRQLLKNYRQGDVFSRINVSYYRRLSVVLIAMFFVNPVHQALSSMAMTFHLEDWSIFVDFYDRDLNLLFIGAIVLLLSYLMEAAFEINEENQMTI